MDEPPIDRPPRSAAPHKPAHKVCFLHGQHISVAADAADLILHLPPLTNHHLLPTDQPWTVLVPRAASILWAIRWVSAISPVMHAAAGYPGRGE